MIPNEFIRDISYKTGIIIREVDDNKKEINALVFTNVNDPHINENLSSKERINELKEILSKHGYNYNIKYKTKRFEQRHNTKTYDRKQKAIAWAEEHGIVEYKIKNKYLIYNVSYPAYLSEPRRTYQFKVDLDTGKTVEKRQLKRYDAKGAFNRH